jgi:hypothetical protein
MTKAGGPAAGPAHRAWTPTAAQRRGGGACLERRWAADVFEVPCWNGEAVRVGFAIDTHDREVLAWTASLRGIGGIAVRDLMLLAVERRFGSFVAPQLVEWLADNGSCFTATRRSPSPTRSASCLASGRCAARSRRSLSDLEPHWKKIAPAERNRYHGVLIQEEATVTSRQTNMRRQLNGQGHEMHVPRSTGPDLARRDLESVEAAKTAVVEV